MGEEDRRRWDARLADRGRPGADDDQVAPPAAFASCQQWFPTSGHALDVACGQGHGAVWLALRGLHVRGVDVSPVAVDHASALAVRTGVSERCRFDVVDLDDCLPPGPPVDVVLCHLYRDGRLDRALVERTTPGGVLAVATLSEVGAEPGPFRARRGELRAAFGHLQVLCDGERDGRAWILARRPALSTSPEAL